MSSHSTLKEYLQLLNDNKLVVNYNIDENKLVENISYNSKDVSKNTLFVCKGEQFSVDYLKDSIKKGATCYVSEKIYLDVETEKCDFILVSDIRKAMSIIGEKYFENSWEPLKLIGVTGTKGKTTTVFFVRNILDEFLKSKGKEKSGFISGITVYDGIEEKDAQLTTSETFELQRHLNNTVKNNIEYTTIEVSSQALKYHRTKGIPFEIGCFLNIGEDHISEFEHSDFQDYFQSKLLLMKQSKIACVNYDIDEAEEVIKSAKGCEKIIAFGSREKNEVLYDHNEIDYLQLYDIKSNKAIDGRYSFKVKCENFDEEFEINLLGDFNIKNALASISISYSLGIPVEYIKKGLKNTKVPGRMEHFYYKKKKMNILVDYAHNYMSFEALMKNIKTIFPNKKISVVFGATGGKGKDRRTQLGELAGIYADKIYVTEDDPANEDLKKICDEILKAIKGDNKNTYVIYDRIDAIKKAISDGDENTVIAITGRGIQKYQIRGNNAIEYMEDMEIVNQIIKEN